MDIFGMLLEWYKDWDRIIQNRFWATIPALISSSVAFTVLFIQRFLDKKRIKKEALPKMAIGIYEQKKGILEIGKYFETEQLIATDRMTPSVIKIPLHNIGKSPISNIDISIELINAMEVISSLPSEKLKFTFSSEIYAELIENKISYKFHGVPESRPIMETYTSSQDFISVIMPGETQFIQFTYVQELYLQFLLYQLQDRVFMKNTDNGVSQIRTPNIECPYPLIEYKITYQDSNGKTRKDNFSSRVLIGGYQRNNMIARIEDPGIHQFHVVIKPVRPDDKFSKKMYVKKGHNKKISLKQQKDLDERTRLNTERHNVRFSRKK